MMQALTPLLKENTAVTAGSVEMALGPPVKGLLLIELRDRDQVSKVQSSGLFYPEDTRENWVSQEVLVKVKSEKDLCKPAGSQQ